MASSRSLSPAGAGRMPVSRVACRIVRSRLATVWSGLQDACVDRPDADAVHRLRVATRRGLAALEAFDELLPRRHRDWVRRRLRRVRRVAGEARDLDVLVQALEPDDAAAAIPPGARARARLVAMLSRQRLQSRQPIRELRDRLVAADWAGRLERLLDRMTRYGRDETFTRYAVRRFKPLMRRFFDRADRRLEDDRELHRLRIEGKKLRYTLEIFAPVFAPRVRVRCEESLQRLQATLGTFTDHAAAADRFRRWAKEDGLRSVRGTLTSLRRHESSRADRARKSFAKWWKPARRRALRRTLTRSLRLDSA